MKKALIFCLSMLMVCVLLAGCSTATTPETSVEATTETATAEASETAEATAEPEATATAAPEETESAEAVATAEASEAPAEAAVLDESAYIGEYLDADNSEPNLEIAKGEDGKFVVQIGIYRLTTLSDGVGELTAEGMTFTATDASGNPIGGIITLDGDKATVTFTDSTWDLLENGSAFEYTKSSDSATLWDVE